MPEENQNQNVNQPAQPQSVQGTPSSTPPTQPPQAPAQQTNQPVAQPAVQQQNQSAPQAPPIQPSEAPAPVPQNQVQQAPVPQVSQTSQVPTQQTNQPISQAPQAPQPVKVADTTTRSAIQAASNAGDNCPIPTAKETIWAKIRRNTYLFWGLIGMAALILAIIIAIIVTRQPAEVANVPRPPDLSSGGNTLKGFIRTDKGFYQYVQSDVEGFVSLEENFPECNPVKLHAGLHYYHLDEPTTISDLFLRNIEPVLGNQILFSIYSPGEKDLNLEEGYYTYPEGTFDNTTLLDPDTLIPAKRGFVLILKQSTYGCLNSSEMPPLQPFSVPLAEDEGGWILLPVDKCADLVPYQSVITALYAQDGENSYKYGSTSDCLNAEYHLNWILVNEGDKPVPGVFDENQALEDMEEDTGNVTLLDDEEDLNLESENNIVYSPPEIVYLELSHNIESPLDTNQELVFRAFANVSATTNLEYQIFKKEDLSEDLSVAAQTQFESDMDVFNEKLLEVDPNDSSRQLEWDLDPALDYRGDYVLMVRAQNANGVSDVKYEEFKIIDTRNLYEEEIPEDTNGSKVSR